MERKQFLIMNEKKHELILIFAALMISCFFLIYEVLDSPKYNKVEASEVVKTQIFPETTKEILTGKINLNTASVEELCTLEEIGESKAAAIIEYRETFGEFRSIEEIMEVDGISDITFSKNIDRLTV